MGLYPYSESALTGRIRVDRMLRRKKKSKGGVPYFSREQSNYQNCKFLSKKRKLT